MRLGTTLGQLRTPEQPDLVDRLENSILPLINLVFLLLMFFLVAGIITRHPLPPLPAQPEGQQGERPKVQMTLNADGDIEIRGQSVTLEGLPGALSVNRDEPIRIAAHAQLPINRLEAVFKTLATTGYDQVRLVTQPGGGQ